MRLGNVITIVRLLAVFTLVFVFLARVTQATALICLAIGMPLAILVVELVFWRCPDCGKFLGGLYVKHCPNCGNRLDLE